jgi:hypothetical protein
VTFAQRQSIATVQLPVTSQAQLQTFQLPIQFSGQQHSGQQFVIAQSQQSTSSDNHGQQPILPKPAHQINTNMQPGAQQISVLPISQCTSAGGQQLFVPLQVNSLRILQERECIIQTQNAKLRLIQRAVDERGVELSTGTFSILIQSTDSDAVLEI